MRFKLRRYYLYYLGRIAAFSAFGGSAFGGKFYILPLVVSLYIGRILGTLAFYALIKYRKIALHNLRLAFGEEKNKAELDKIAKRAFENLGKTAVEIVNFPKINKSNIDKFVKIENIDILDSALKRGKGAIVLTGHFGNWELLASTLRLKGYPGAAIGRRIYFDRFDRFDRYLNSLRKIHDVNIIYRDESPKKLLRVLKDNGIIGVLADQDVDSVDGVFVDFFGRPAYTPIGPVALAKASGAALVPLFMLREDGHHTLMIEKPIELVDTGDKDKDMVENTQRWSNTIESYIRRRPEQWVWMHRRWKTEKSQK